MRFLVDQCVSPIVAAGLVQIGFDAVHAEEVGRATASDAALLEFARDEDRIIITTDSDFGDLLAAQRAGKPSVILLRDDAPTNAIQIVAVVEANLTQLRESLITGALVVVRAARIRVRMLPLI